MQEHLGVSPEVTDGKPSQALEGIKILSRVEKEVRENKPEVIGENNSPMLEVKTSAPWKGPSLEELQRWQQDNPDTRPMGQPRR